MNVDVIYLIKDKYTLKACKLPRFYRWGGGGVPFRWSFGWFTGVDNDLVCVSPTVKTRSKENHLLSPVYPNRFLAFVAIVMKALLVKIDWNLRG